MAKLTIEERKAKAQEELKRLEVLEIVENKVNDILEELKNSIEEEHHRYIGVGKMEEQATDSNGELLWEAKGTWRNIPTSELTEEQRKTAKPYYRTKYEERRVEYDELPDYSRNKVEALKMLSELIKSLEY